MNFSQTLEEQSINPHEMDTHFDNWKNIESTNYENVPISLEDDKIPSNKKACITKLQIKDKSQGVWTKEEHYRFVEAIGMYGNQWGRVIDYVKTRSYLQVRSHSQKYFKKIQRRNLKKLRKKYGKVKPIFLATRLYLNHASTMPKNAIELYDTLPRKTKAKKKHGNNKPTEKPQKKLKLDDQSQKESDQTEDIHKPLGIVQSDHAYLSKVNYVE